MSDETLIPFDPAIARQHPQRVRHIEKPELRGLEVGVFTSGTIVIHWSTGEVAGYASDDVLRLTAPPTKTVMVQCFEYVGSPIFKDEHRFAPVGSDLPSSFRPFGEPQPFEVPE